MKWIKEVKQTVLVFLKTWPKPAKIVSEISVDSVNVFEEVEERYNIS